MKLHQTLPIVALVGVLAVPAAFAQGQARGRNKQNDRERRAAQIEARFRGMDKDSDSVITRAEWTGNEQSFLRHDTNHDNVLSGDEVRVAIRAEQAALPPAPPPAAPVRRGQDYAARFTRADRNNDGRIARDEWLGTAEAFQRMDVNRDAVVTRDEFMGEQAAPPPPPPVRRTQDDAARFTRADRNNDGRIARDEWLGTAEAFQRMDVNRDAIVTRDEFMAANRPAAAAANVNTPGYRAGYDRGMVEGRQAGKEDKTINGGKWDLEGQRELEQADSGYESRLGAREDYQAGYRAGFRKGYREGFGPR